MSNVNFSSTGLPILLNLSVLEDRVINFADSRSYPSRTVRGMYKQEQELSKADEAGLILTAADLQHMHSCECCGENEAYPDGLCAKCWNELKAHNE